MEEVDGSEDIFSDREDFRVGRISDWHSNVRKVEFEDENYRWVMLKMSSTDINLFSDTGRHRSIIPPSYTNPRWGSWSGQTPA